MKLILATLTLLVGFSAHADYRCNTRSGSRTYSNARDTQIEARAVTLQHCLQNYRNNYSDCSYNMSCSYVYDRSSGGRDSSGGWNNDGGMSRRGSRPPTVDASFCYVSQTGQWVGGDRFFSLAHEHAVANNRCVVARIARESYSARVYDQSGRRIGSSGGMSNSEVENILSMYGLYGCAKFSCEESIF